MFVNHLTDAINAQIWEQQRLITKLRLRIHSCSGVDTADDEVKLHQMLAHALAGLAALSLSVPENSDDAPINH
jgi:hypothetical protein